MITKYKINHSVLSLSGNESNSVLRDQNCSRLQEESVRNSAQKEGRVVWDLEQTFSAFAKMEKLERHARQLVCIYVVIGCRLFRSFEFF